MQINENIIIAKAIEHDKEALTWFGYWKERGENENDVYHRTWLEHHIKCDAMIELLNEIEPFYTHYVFDGKMHKELIP